MKLKKVKSGAGFTLIEILVVIGIIAILAAVVLIAINPARQFAQARDTQRNSNVNALLNAVGQYMADHKGKLTDCYGYANVTGSGPYTIASSTSMSGLINLYECLVPKYIAQMPIDPSDGEPLNSNEYDTKYKFSTSTDGRVTISATAEGDNPISITR